MSGIKTSMQQEVLLLEWLEDPDNRCVLTGNSHVMSPDMIKKKRSEVTVILNSCGSGTSKTPDKWRKTLNELRCHIKKKQRMIIADTKVTGGGRALATPLTDIEHRFLNLFGKITIEGAPNMMEVGLGQEVNLQPMVSAHSQMEQIEEIEENFENLGPTIEIASQVQPCTPSHREEEAYPPSYRAGRSAIRPRPYAATGTRAERASQIFASSAQAQADALKTVAASIDRLTDAQLASNALTAQALDRFSASLEAAVDCFKQFLHK